MGGWQQYQVVDASQAAVLHKVDNPVVPPSAYLGVVGMPGWYGLTQIIKPDHGQTVVFSAAGGAVGQLAKARGCRAVGLAGGPAEVRLCDRRARL